MIVVAITGATGEVGRRVAALLDSPVLIARNAERAPAGARIASGYGDFEAMNAAFDGVDTAFIIPAAEAVDRIEQHKVAIDAAVAAGVSRIVYLSFLGAAPDATFTLARDHWATEEHIRAAGVRFTFLRMNLYMDFIPGMAQHGVIRGPAGAGRVSAILRDDVAAAAAAVLKAPRDGETFDLTGPSAFSLVEAAALMGAVYVDETDEEAYASRAQFDAPDWEIAGWVSSYQAIREGSLAGVSSAVRELTGREPASLHEYLRTGLSPS